MVKSDEERLSRKERRRRTEATILASARKLFAEHGFERTTIRAVAAAASVDPALVMQHFGSKDGLFAAAARSTVELESLVEAKREELPHAALQHVLATFDDPNRGKSDEAILRSSFTHPAAREIMREDAIKTQSTVARIIGGDDAELRAAVLNACTLGVTIARYMLRIPALADATAEDVERVMGPALRAIVGPHDA